MLCNLIFPQLEFSASQKGMALKTIEGYSRLTGHPPRDSRFIVENRDRLGVYFSD